MSKILTILACAAVRVPAVLLSAEAAIAAECIIKNNQNSAPVIEIVNNSNCEVCGYSYVMIVINNRYNNSPTHTLHLDRPAAPLTGVVFESTASTAATCSVNGGITQAGKVSGASSLTFNNRPDVSTWNSNNVGDPIPNSPVYLGGKAWA